MCGLLSVPFTDGTGCIYLPYITLRTRKMTYGVVGRRKSSARCLAMCYVEFQCERCLSPAVIGEACPVIRCPGLADYRLKPLLYRVGQFREQYRLG